METKEKGSVSAGRWFWFGIFSLTGVISSLVLPFALEGFHRPKLEESLCPIDECRQSEEVLSMEGEVERKSSEVFFRL